MDESLRRKRVEAGRKGGKIGGKAKVKKGFAVRKDIARQNAQKTNAKKRAEHQF